MIADFFRDFEIFTEQEISKVIQLFELRVLDKGDYFVRENQRCNEVAFIKSGIFRSFYTTPKGDDITYCFRFPNDLIAAYSSFITGNPSVEAIQAISQVSLLVIQKNKLDELVLENQIWTQFLKVIAEQQYLELEKRVFQLQKETAAQRYASLLKNQPQFILQIPLHYLASYLGITQRHLSRIRKEITF
ncbi:Crp/Fnr family transcriptional regulator [Sphingobacterium faecium]